ncbi:putative Mitochondrial transcription termination factor family protein [Hibiscus syriacus]|uniref:Mitochondrial transcription termination factor family protein n=1 Tax=Hibiscus syriacus TaxID=106335 RepID=A0A6A3BKN1_HIBSY|nr:putative Mitochondrial transcription termination factor family protein [Hibiscus syriacus]
MEEEKPLPFDFMGVGGDTRDREINPEQRFTTSSSSSTTNKEIGGEIHCTEKKKNSGALPSFSTMEGGQLVVFDFMGVMGDTRREREINPGREESNFLLDLSHSLATTGREDIHCKKSESYTKMCYMEKNNGAFPFESSNAATDGRISLELSPSKTDMGKQVIEYKESDNRYTRNIDARNMICMKKKNSGALSHEPTDLSLKVSPAVNKSWGFEVGECSNMNHHNLNKSCSMSQHFDGALTLLALNDDFKSHKKRKPMKNPKHSSTINKRRRVEPEAVPRRPMADHLRVGPANDPWVIKKGLFKSDLGDNSRLLLASELVESHILPHWDADRRAQIHNGLQVLIYDCDTNSEHAMIFKRWGNGAYVLIKKWIQNFVSRRDLKLNDQIGLYWDIDPPTIIPCEKQSRHRLLRFQLELRVNLFQAFSADDFQNMATLNVEEFLSFCSRKKWRVKAGNAVESEFVGQPVVLEERRNPTLSDDSTVKQTHEECESEGEAKIEHPNGGIDEETRSSTISPRVWPHHALTLLLDARHRRLIPEAVELLLKTHDLVFASRPPLEASKYISYNQQNRVFSAYDSYWRNMCKMCTLELLSNYKISSFRSMRKQELDLLVHRIREAAGGGVAVDFRIDVTIREGMQIAAALNLADYIPQIRGPDLQGLTKRMKIIAKDFDDFFEKIIEEHVQSQDENRVKDFVDIMLGFMGSEEAHEYCVDRDAIKAIILDMLAASMNTSAATIDWTMAELMRHPQVTKKLQKELKDVAGTKRTVEESDLENLEYLDMVMKESFRLHPVGPLLVPHAAREDCTVNGFHIAKDARILVNAWAIGRDERVWTDAEKSQRMPRNATGTHRRSAQLVHCFDWELPDNMSATALDMSEEFGPVCPRAKHLAAIPAWSLIT